MRKVSRRSGFEEMIQMHAVKLKSFKNRVLGDIGLNKEDIHIFFQDNSEIVIRCPEAYLDKDVIHTIIDHINIPGYLNIGAIFNSADFKLEYQLTSSSYLIYVSFYFLHGAVCHAFAIKYEMPETAFINGDPLIHVDANFPNETPLLIGDTTCHATQEITKKNTKPMTALMQ